MDDPEWREMTDQRRKAAFGLLEAALSPRGMKLTRDIMRLNETLAELTNDHQFLGEWQYFITVMGKPSATEPWGFQLDGHHAIINYFVLGDQVVMTPFFAGSEPAIATSVSTRESRSFRRNRIKGWRCCCRWMKPCASGRFSIPTRRRPTT